MILVDSSVWIDAFRGIMRPPVELLRHLISAGEAAVGDLMLAEVLRGCRTDREFHLLRKAFELTPLIEIVGKAGAVAAAQNYRVLRAKGITIRKTIDTLIATRCILDRIPLLYSDRDFDPFVEHLGLIPALPALGALQ